MDAMRHRSIDRETFDRLLTDMTRVRQFVGDPEILAGRHHDLGFVALVRHGNAFVALLDALRPDQCFAGPEPGRSAAIQLPSEPALTRTQRDHRSKPTSVAFLALAAIVAITWGLGLGWLAYKIVGAAISLASVVLSHMQI